MIQIANDLSQDFPHVRVDLYWVNKKIYFGDLTFYLLSGYEVFKPDSFDYVLGDEFTLPKIRKWDEYVNNEGTFLPRWAIKKRWK